MGRQDEPEQLFHAFRLEIHVPRDHVLRRIDAGTIRKSLEPYYSSTGRPSVDPELMIRMLLLGYSFGIRSERRLCEEVHLNLAYRWFCHLGLEGSVPDHSTFSKNRHGRFRESNLFRRVFEDVVRACMAAGLIGSEGFAIDASVIEADASCNRRVEGERLRDEIIEAAIKVLLTIGPEDPFSLRAVAKEEKIAAPSVYIHFADRNLLRLAVLEKLFGEQVALRAVAEEQAALACGGAWEHLLARSIAAVEFGLKHPGHYKVLFEGRVVLRLNDPRIADFGRPLLVRSIELIRDIPPASAKARVSEDPQRLALLLWSGLHGVISLRITKPTLDWPSATELAEQVTRAIIQPR